MADAVKIEELRLDDDRSYRVAANGERRMRGVALAHLIEKFGGTYSGTVEHPVTGEATNIDLAPWKGRDPDKTYLRLRFDIAEDQFEDFERRIGRTEFAEQVRQARKRAG